MTQTIPFIKAQALGNDFILIERTQGFKDLTPNQIRKLADRRLGIGCDQLVMFECPSIQSASPPILVSFYNADGSEANACGNGSRALANFLFQDRGYQSPLILRTKGGDLSAEHIFEGQVALTFPEPLFTNHWDLTQLPLTRGQIGSHLTVDVGNPHLICFVNDLSEVNVVRQGALLESHPIFDNKGINVSFAQCPNQQSIQLRVWERGAGFTSACGTGACATMAAAFHLGMIDDTVTVHQLGGDLDVSWRDGIFTMKGPAKSVFTGMIGIE